jgi:peroxiredoxin Q/BCP
MPDLKVGDRAPDFAVESTEGEVNLRDYRGRNLVIYFYVRDETPGCTMQSCSLRDGIDRIREMNAEVLGISVDDIASHRKFKEKERLNFPLVADTNFMISRSFGAFNEERQMSRRMTFIIDKNGIVRHIMPKVDVRAHAEEVLQALKSIRQE